MKYSKSILVPITPQPKRRVRATTSKGKIVTYKDEKTKRYENSLSLYLKQHAPSKPLLGAIGLSIRFLHARPKRLSVKAKNGVVTCAGRIWKKTRPDVDNLTKAISDCLQTAGFFRDDGQIASIDARDFYTEDGQEPRIEIFISELAERQGIHAG
jgi:Holliday junction resolvase RusA-like endonuclease